MKIALLCNSRLALPTISALFQMGIDLSVGVPDRTSEDVETIKSFLRSQGKSAQIIKGDRSEKDLRIWVQREKPQAVFILTFPFLIPESLFFEVPLGWYNFHFAPLPEYRGAEPIFWLIRNRASEGGISVHKVTAQVDAGPIVYQEKLPIEDSDTHGTHMQKLSLMAPKAAHALLQMLHQFGRFLPAREVDVTDKPTLSKAGVDDLTIDWENMTADEILALIRACNPWNKGAFSFIDGHPLKIAQAHLAGDASEDPLAPGKIVLRNGKMLVKTCDQKFIALDIIVTDDGIFTADVFNKTYGIDNKAFNNKSIHISIT